MSTSSESEPERDSGAGSRLLAAADRLLGFAERKAEGRAATPPEAAAEVEVPADEVVVVEEWVEPDERGRDSEPGWHGNPVLGWYRTDAAEGKDPNVGPAPRPGGPRPGGPRPGGPRPGVRPSGPPAE